MAHFSLSQDAPPIDFETLPQQPEDYDDIHIDTGYFDGSVNELPWVTETPDGNKTRQQSSISVVGPQTPINWHHVQESSPPPKTLQPPHPDTSLKCKHTYCVIPWLCLVSTEWYSRVFSTIKFGTGHPDQSCVFTGNNNLT